MTKSKTETLQMRIDAELLQRFKNFADNQGLSISAALRQTMLRNCDQFDAYMKRKKFEEERWMNKK